MGSAFSKRKVRVLIVGLDNSGKSSIVDWLRGNKGNVAPTVGYNNETVEKFNLNFNFLDMSGQQQYRDMWEQFTQKIDGLIFVIDAADQLRFSIMANELQVLMESEGFSHSLPILMYANKADQGEAQCADFFIEYLKLKQMQNPHMIVASSVKSGVGIDQGLQWLSNQIQSVKKV